MSSNWKCVFGIVFSLFGLQLAYCYAFFSGALEQALLGATAATGGYLIGLSLGLGPAVRHFGLAKRKLRNRRALGVAGFLFSLLYSCALLSASPADPDYVFSSGVFTMPNLLGGFSVLVLALMTTLSNRAAISTLGSRRWKRTMRWGYAAYFALVLRAALIEGELWLAWIAAPSVQLPPPRLLLSVFAMLVIVLGLAQHFNDKHTGSIDS